MNAALQSRRRAIESALRHLAPRIPAHEFGAIVDHALLIEIAAHPEDGPRTGTRATGGGAN